MFEQERFPIVSTSSLLEIAKSHSLRCDAKQTEKRFIELEKILQGQDCFYLGALLPSPLVKGVQHIYLDTQNGVAVINTLSIQDLQIREEGCRYITEDDFAALSDDRKLKINDVLLTMDGGTSIGKPVLFDLNGDWTVDSHVAILRPKGISPKALVYLIASPLGQIQFQKAESGASGQTAVTEEDLRRFIFPKTALVRIETLTRTLDKKRKAIQIERERLKKLENSSWEEFTKTLIR